jgi:hypothetical protein
MTTPGQAGNLDITFPAEFVGVVPAPYDVTVFADKAAGAQMKIEQKSEGLFSGTIGSLAVYNAVRDALGDDVRLIYTLPQRLVTPPYASLVYESMRNFAKL